MAATLASIFVETKGLPIGDYVKSFDFSKIDTKDVTRDDSLHVVLAPSYGKLNSASMKMMDDELKIMIAGTMKALAAVPPEERTWKMVMSVLMQNPVVEPDGSAGVSRSDKLIKSSSDDFKWNGDPNEPIFKEVKSWFTALINDADVLGSIAFDMNVLGNIVARTGATIKTFQDLFVNTERHEKTLVDIGVLRFPDPDRPHFQVYNITLTAWSQSDRIVFHSEDNNGITGEYNSRNFVPRKSVIAELQPKAHAAAVQMANDLFS